jgi:hypothetical protein
VSAHAHEIFRSSFLVQADEIIRIEVFAMPGRDDVLVTKLGRMAESFDVMSILPAAFDVEIARVPIAVFSGRLWTPVRPDAELGVGEPIRASISFERFPRAFEDRASVFLLGHRRGDLDCWNRTRNKL